MLSTEKVKDIIKNGVSSKIQSARDYSSILNMHVTGNDVDKYIEEFKRFENDAQKKIRQRLQKSNKSVFSFLTRPLDKVFTAKGGVISFNSSEKQIDLLKEFISDVNDGLDISTYLYKKVKTNYLTDPNGFVMLDIDEEGGLQVNVYNTSDVIYYDNKGNHIKSIVFNPYNKDEEGREYYRVIDELTDSVWVKDGEDVFLEESSVLENYFKFVPAFILGDIYDVNSDKFLSLIDEVLDDAKELLRDVSVKVVHKLAHGYPVYWERPSDCITCDGTGKIGDKSCGSCDGTGYRRTKDVSDTIIVPLPEGDEKDVAPHIAGYISPNLETWKQYKEDIKDLKHSMFQTLWGSTFQINSKNETATGRLLNVQPEAERVANVSKTFAKIHEFILDCYGKIALSDLKYKSNVSYGTRYLMESPDELLNQYKEAKNSNLPSSLQMDLLKKYYQTEHANNNIEYVKTKKILATDPFPNLSPKEVKELGVSEKDLMLKIYHSQWLNQLTEAKKVLMTEDELRKDLEQYVELKIKENGKVQQNAIEPTE